MRKDIYEYIKSCNSCQRKEGTCPTELLNPIKVEQPFDRIAQQKEWHDNKLPSVINELKIGNKVLLHRTKAEKQWSGKFENKWDKPFFIHKVLGNRSYKLRLDDKILAKVAHGDHLKHYNSKNNPELLIPQIGIHSPLINPEDITRNLEPIVVIEQPPT
ncbi:hypothetical protein G9A89_016260 [Geosiphon pyriformis]|nr:hypothetical protein G9A89_016260 [Geosiphon pyriformis]